MSDNRDTLLRQWEMLRRIPRAPLRTSAEQLHRELTSAGFITSKRTIERDLQTMITAFPITCDDSDKPYSWYWPKDAHIFDVPGIGNSEALTFKLVETYLRPLLPDSILSQLTPYFSAATKHLAAISSESPTGAWPNKVRVVYPTQPLIPPKIDESVQRAVYDATLKQRQLEISYQKTDGSPASALRIHPLGMVQRGQIFYLVCTVFNYTDIRMLAMHRIKSATILDDLAPPPEDFNLDDYINSGAFGFGSPELTELELIFYDNAGNHLKETPLSADQVIEEREDGTLHIKATVLMTEQTYWWLLSFGRHVQVLSPVPVREYMQQVAKEMADMYHGAPQ